MTQWIQQMMFVVVVVFLGNTHDILLASSFGPNVHLHGPRSLSLSPSCLRVASSSEPQSPVNEFVCHVQRSIFDRTFESVTLNGTSKKKSKDERLRGSIRQVQGRLILTKKNREALQLTVKYHGATDICKNIVPEEIPTQLEQFIMEPLASEWGAETAQPFQSAELKTLNELLELKSLSNKPKIQRRALSSPSVTTKVKPTSHDRTKQVPLAQTNDTSFLTALGLNKPDGSPRPGMTSKLRQCNKFVEIVKGLVERSSKPEKIQVVDMGCGRGYLTFALHAYLSETYPNVASLGIDVRPKLMAEVSDIASSLGGPFHKLAFETGSIEEIVAGTSLFQESTAGDIVDGISSLNILIALHACDTATDDALWTGISQEADIIVVAPCCHKQVRAQLDAHIVAEKKKHPLFDILKHGVYRERISETVTDSLRALLLEKAGYKVQVFEFIGGEHTSKNVMITATRSPKSAPKDIDKRIDELASFHGVKQQKLATWMGYSLNDEPPKNLDPKGERIKLNTMRMPPIKTTT